MQVASAVAVLFWEWFCCEASELYDYEYSEGYGADHYRNYGEGPASDVGRVRRFGEVGGRSNGTSSRENYDLNRAFKQIQSGRKIDSNIPMQITRTEPHQVYTGLTPYQQVDYTGFTEDFKTYLVTADMVSAPHRTRVPMTSRAMQVTSVSHQEISRTHFLRHSKSVEASGKGFEIEPYGVHDYIRGQAHDQAKGFHQASNVSIESPVLRGDEDAPTTTEEAPDQIAAPDGEVTAVAEDPEAATAVTTTTIATTTITTITTTKPSTQFDIEKFLEIVANLTYDYETNLTRQVNETLYKMSIPTCPTPTTEHSTTTEMEYHALNRTIISKCFVCGLEAAGIPFDADCADAFAGDFLPLVPQDPRAKGKIARYRKYCRYGEFHNYFQNASQPRTLYGRWTGGCSVRWTDLSGVYTQRACRNRKRAVTGLHYASKRMAKLEMALANTDSGCIVAPVATLLPLSRGISLFARFHACVCVGSWCNRAVRSVTALQPLLLAAAAVGAGYLSVLLAL